MPNMASESAPLRELLENQVAWHWNQEQETSFHKLKQMVSSTPVLGCYHHNHHHHHLFALLKYKDKK